MFTANELVKRYVMKSTKEILIESDKFYKNKDVEGIYKIIDEAKEIAEKIEEIFEKVQLFYSIATSYSDIYVLEYKNMSEDEREVIFENQIFYFRLAIQFIAVDKFITWNRYDDYDTQNLLLDGIFDEFSTSSDEKQLYGQLFVNLGNCYDEIYRPIDALACFRRALLYVPNFPMALGNKGIALTSYSQFFSSDYADGLRKLSYEILNNVCKDADYLEKYYPSALKDFSMWKERLEKHYSNNLKWLRSDIDIHGKYGDDENEEKYKTWVAAKGLFLNPLNDDNHLVYSIDDILHLPNMIYHIDDDRFKHAGLLNQIKQEFVSSRYLFYFSSEGIVDAHFSDRGNLILNTLDYTNESYYDYLQKTCFKSLHSILDRVAFFINDYFDIGIEERDVSFRMIWRKEKNGKNGYIFKNNLIDIMKSNYALKGLYWLAKDIQQENYKSPIKPYCFDYKDLRNYLEHKYVKTLKEIFYTGKDDERKDSLAYYITEAELYIANLELLRLVRAIIISLISAIDINENKKKKELEEKGKYIPSISHDKIEDDWKM